MANNLIPVIADNLGVRIDEEFDVNIPHMGETRLCRYKLTKQGLVRKRENGEWRSSPGFFERLVSGDFEIIKLPYEPRYLESYWTYHANCFAVVEDYWRDTAIDYARKFAGIVFRTKTEALDALSEKYRQLTNEEWRGDK